MTNAFADTKNLFREYTGYTQPLSYEEWMAKPDDQKAVILYVQFYEQITLAWYKTKSFFVQEEDGVDTMVQYLMKNVPIIKENPNRFKASYIYQVAYNCLYCISHDIQRDKDRWALETSNIAGEYDNGVEIDLFDTIIDNCQDSEGNMTRKLFWAVIEQMGPETEKVINYLLNGQSLGKATFRMSDPSLKASWEKKTAREKDQAMLAYTAGKSNYELDPLKDISVSAERAEEIIKELQEKLDAFKSVYYN